MFSDVCGSCFLMVGILIYIVKRKRKECWLHEMCSLCSKGSGSTRGTRKVRVVMQNVSRTDLEDMFVEETEHWRRTNTTRL